jgi:hypothetical protein
MSTNNGKVKVYKNPARSRPDTQKNYVPQYQLMGVQPEEYKSPLAPGYQGQVLANKTPGPTQDNPRTRRPGMTQPYAEAISSPVGRGRGPLPNVGNNIEQTWSSVDGEIVDDISHQPVEDNHHMVDNNDFVTEEALGLPPESLQQTSQPEAKSFLTQNELKDAIKDDFFQIVGQLDEGDFLLLVSGEPVCSGPIEYVQEEARNLVFGEHPLYNNNPVSVDDIIVIKRVQLKVGVFLE